MGWGVATLSPGLDQKFTDLDLGTLNIVGKINPDRKRARGKGKGGFLNPWDEIKAYGRSSHRDRSSRVEEPSDTT